MTTAHFFKSFIFAMNGIWLALRQERNFRILWLCGLFILLLNLLIEFSITQQIIMLILSFGILSLELINSAIEHTCNATGHSFNNEKKCAKDFAAGSVVLFSLMIFACFYIIFEHNFSLITNTIISKKYAFIGLALLTLIHIFLCFKTPRLSTIWSLVIISFILHGVLVFHMHFSIMFLFLSSIWHVSLGLAHVHRIGKELSYHA